MTASAVQALTETSVPATPAHAGSNPFKQFGAGAGFGIKAKKRNTKCPLEVQQLGLPEIVISEDSERDQQRQVLQVSLRASGCSWAAVGSPVRFLMCLVCLA
eukprot:357733-Pelagomonas_calceolata.AAC.4